MSLEKRNPTAVRRQGFENGMVSQAVSNFVATALTSENQQVDVVGLLASRSGVAAATVRAHCLAFGIGARP